LQYDNAGTVEFIYDDKTGDFYFLEVNTRLQVEHPVTEEVTGLDLVEMQIESAQGLPLQIQQADIELKGYALELRLYAEDAANDFMPVTGKVEQFSYPNVDGLRVEAAVESGSEISVFYDPMIAKLIVWDENRAGAFRKMTYVLKNMVCAGTVTNQDFLLLLTQNAEVREGKYDTHFIQNKLDLNSLRNKTAFDLHQAGIAATLKSWQERENKRTILKALPSGWRNNFAYPQQEIFIHNEKEILVQYRYQKSSFVFAIEEQEYHVDLIEANENGVRCEINGMQLKFQLLSNHPKFFVQNEAFGLITLEEKDRFPAKVQEKIKGGYEAPIPSQIIKILVDPGQKVTSGDALLILSSMKMENTLCANEDGTVEEIYVNEGGNVEAGTLLLKLTEN
jgi:3-methylcrotonyl-CoA carboxylase alpha subunit